MTSAENGLAKFVAAANALGAAADAELDVLEGELANLQLALAEAEARLDGIAIMVTEQLAEARQALTKCRERIAKKASR